MGCIAKRVMTQSSSPSDLTSSLSRLKMPVNWWRPESSRLTHHWAIIARRVIVAIDVEESHGPRAHGDVTVTLSYSNSRRGGSHRDIWLILVALNSHCTYTRLSKVTALASDHPKCTLLAKNICKDCCHVQIFSILTFWQWQMYNRSSIIPRHIYFIF